MPESAISFERSKKPLQLTTAKRRCGHTSMQYATADGLRSDTCHIDAAEPALVGSSLSPCESSINLRGSTASAIRIPALQTMRALAR
eukprot:13503184-Alexandrium_andersonii.AAC.1